MAYRKTRVVYRKQGYKEIVLPKHIWLIKETSCIVDELPDLYSKWTTLSNDEFLRLDGNNFPPVSKFYKKLSLFPANLVLNVSQVGKPKFFEGKSISLGILRILLNRIIDLKKSGEVFFSPQFSAYLSRNKPLPALEIMALFYNIASIVNFGLPLGSLYASAKEGNDKALFRLLQIDKSVIQENWVKERINKAHLVGRRSFFDSIGFALRKDPISKKRKRIKLFFTFTILIVLDYWDRLTFCEICELLRENGIADMDEVTLGRLARRYGLKKKESADM